MAASTHLCRNDIKTMADRFLRTTKGTSLRQYLQVRDGRQAGVDLPISNGYFISETQAPYAYIRNSKDVYSFNFNVLPETR